MINWQTGPFGRHQNIRFTFPIGFLNLCKLFDITPEEILKDFTDNLSCGSWKRQGRDDAKKKLIEYVIEHGYGQAYYSIEEIRQVFKEMDALGMLFPKDGSSELIDLYSKWRSDHWNYWFDKWFHLHDRKK